MQVLRDVGETVMYKQITDIYLRFLQLPIAEEMLQAFCSL